MVYFPAPLYSTAHDFCREVKQEGKDKGNEREEKRDGGHFKTAYFAIMRM
jgi:hypothetical protein